MVPDRAEPAVPTFETKRLPAKESHEAPDHSKIRLLARTQKGGLCHCTLPPRCISSAVTHRNVDEIWYFLSGFGEVWRKDDRTEAIEEVSVGVSLSRFLPEHVSSSGILGMSRYTSLSPQSLLGQDLTRLCLFRVAGNSDAGPLGRRRRYLNVQRPNQHP
jgi:hypothetical protein